MKNKFLFGVCYALCLLLFLFGVAAFVFGNPEGGISEAENRALAALPTLSAQGWADTSFMSSFEKYLTDQMPYRDALLDASDTLRAQFNATDARDAILAINMEELLVDMNGEELPDLLDEADPADTQEEEDLIGVPPDPHGAEVDEEFVDVTGGGVAGDGVTRFRYKTPDGGTAAIMSFSKSAVEATARTLNAYRDALPENGTVTFLQTPYSQTANGWLFRPTYYCGWESNVEAFLQTMVKDGVYILCTPGILEAPMQAGEICYFQTDHHWTALGASYMTDAALANCNLPIVPYAEYSYTVHDPFYGSISTEMHALANHSISDRLEIPSPLAPTTAGLYKNLDVYMRDVAYMRPQKTNYMAFLGGTNSPWFEVITGFHTGRRALVICDSFGNAFIPYLTPYYDAVYQVDPRPDYNWETMGGANLREYIAHYEITDVYFVFGTGAGIRSRIMTKTVLEYLG